MSQYSGLIFIAHLTIELGSSIQASSLNFSTSPSGPLVSPTLSISPTPIPLHQPALPHRTPLQTPQPHKHPRDTHPPINNPDTITTRVQNPASSSISRCAAARAASRRVWRLVSSTLCVWMIGSGLNSAPTSGRAPPSVVPLVLAAWLYGRGASCPPCA